VTPILEVQDITKSFFGVPAVRNVSLSLEGGHMLGLIGQNGAGKSTLMNLIGGVITPDSGAMTFKGQAYAPRTPADAFAAGIAFIHQELNLFTNLSIAENIFIEKFPARGRGPFKFVDRREVRKRTKEMLKSVGLDLSPDILVERISPGERQLVEIAKALYQDASLIIFDEPTTSLTARETDRLFSLMRQLREQGKAIVYISHILNDVLKLTDEIAVMRDGQLVGYGPASTLSVNKMITLMVGRTIDQLFPTRSAAPEPVPLLTVNGLTEPGIVQDVSLTLHKGEVLGLFGLMGSGRTELARMLFGLDSFSRGEIRVDESAVGKPSPRRSIHHKVAFVTENRREEGLLMNINIADNIALASLPAFSRTPAQVIDQRTLVDSSRRIGGMLQLKSGDISVQEAKSLSGGNQQKVVIAKWLLSEPSVILMDEPTRGVDVGAKYEIYSIIDQLAAAGQGVLFISSELEELMAMCDRIVVMSRGEIVAEFPRGQFAEEALLHAAFREGEAAL